MYLFKCERDYTISNGSGCSYVGYFPIALVIALSREVICDVISAVDKVFNEGCDHLRKGYGLAPYYPKRLVSKGYIRVRANLMPIVDHSPKQILVRSVGNRCSPILATVVYVC